MVPELFSSSTLDLGYTWKYNSYKIIPAFHYMHQFDHGAGEMRGSNRISLKSLKAFQIFMAK